MGANDKDGNGIGNISVGNQSNSVATTAGSSGTNDGSGSGSGSSSGGSSSSSSGSSSNGGSNSNNNGGTSNRQLTQSAAQAIASDHVLEEGCYVKYVDFSNGYWIFNVYDADGNIVDTIGVNDATGMTDRV